MILTQNGLILMVVAMALGLGTQAFVNSTYRRYSAVHSASGMPGAAVARRILDSEGLAEVGIERVPGNLTDHYDPRAKVLRLSSAVHDGATVAAAGVAAHEAGHAVQHARGYVFATVRGALVPAATLGSNAAPMLILVGFLINLSGLVWLGIAFFAGAVLFQVVTLPVELDASSRATTALATSGALSEAELPGARSVLTAAALTYLAGALVSVLYLLYYVGLARGRD